MESNHDNGGYEKDSLEILFLMIGCFSLWKAVLFFNPYFGSRVVTFFYGLICVTAFLRAISLFVGNGFNQKPQTVVAFLSTGWSSVLTMEVAQVVGSILIYSVFILLVSFWSHMSIKVTDREIAESRPLLHIRSGSSRRGPLEKFFLVLTAFLFIEFLNIILFLFGLYSSTVLVLYDSIVFGVISAVILIETIVFSSRVTNILKTMEAINSDSSSFQIKRIRAITVVNVIYLLFRCGVECFFIMIFFLKRSVYSGTILPTYEWSLYLRTRAWSDAAILLMQLIISASMASGDEDTRNNVEMTTNINYR